MCVKLRQENDEKEKKPLFQKINTSKKLQISGRNKSPPNKGAGFGRHRSPIMGTNREGSGVKISNVNNPAPQNNCELSSQAGIKIYSDIKQITTKKIQVKKTATQAPSSGGQARKNFLQRNIARSQGARSGSNQNNKPTAIPPVLSQDGGGTPVQKNR